MKTSTKVLMCFAGAALVALGVICIVYPASTILSLAWLLGLMMLVAGFSTFGAWANLRTFNPSTSAAVLSWFVGLAIIFNGIGYWVKVTVVTKLEKRLNTLKDRFGRVFEIEDVEPIK